MSSETTTAPRQGRPRTGARAWTLPLLLAAGLPAAAWADEASRGQAIAERWCSRCHVVTPGAPGGDAGPPFASIAVEETGTEAATRAWLFDPHDPMPDMDLSASQISDIIAHIRTLRGEGAQ